jgi:hypothetical protein
MSFDPRHAVDAQSRNHLALALGVCVLSACVFASGAAAQSVKPPANMKQYHALVRQAVEQYERDNYDEAMVLFTEAHRLFPNARTLRGLGMVAYTMRDYVQAIPYLEGAIASRVKPLDPSLIVEAQATIQRARSFIGVLRVVLAPADAQLRVNGAAATLGKDGTLMLNSGAYEIEARAPGFQTSTRLVRIEPGSSLEVDLTLLRDATPNVALSPAAPAPAPEVVANSEPQISLETESAPSGKSVAPWIVVGVSGAVAIGGGVLLGLALQDVSTVENTPPTTDWSKVESKYERTSALSTIGIVMIGAGVAGVAAGLTWHFLERDESEKFALDVSPLGVRLHARW